MVVLEAEAALAVAEALADDVAGGVLAPPLGVPTGDDGGGRPAPALRLGVEKPRPLVAALPVVAVAVAAAAASAAVVVGGAGARR